MTESYLFEKQNEATENLLIHLSLLTFAIASKNVGKIMQNHRSVYSISYSRQLSRQKEVFQREM